MTTIQFEYNIPVFAGAPENGTEPLHRDTPQYETLEWDKTKQGIQRAEELGFDAVWAPDHFMLGKNAAEFECWTLLSTIAGMTEDVNIGSLVLCNDYRNPALVAKMAATLDVLSGGRLELGLGAGWFETEYDAYGFTYHDDFERLLRLDEAIRLIRAMWADDGSETDFSGEYYELNGAPCRPSPVQDQGPPILVGGTGEQVTLKLVAKHADIWNTDITAGSASALERKIGVIEDHCTTVGRDPDEITYSWDGHVICTRDSEKRDRLLDLLTPIHFESDYREDIEITAENAESYFIIGTPEECIEQLETRIDLGVTKFQCWFVDFPSLDGMELFADEVMPALQ